MKKITALAAVAAFSLFSQTAHSAELLTNGSFESATSLNSSGFCYLGMAPSDCGSINGWSGTTSGQIAANSAAFGTPQSRTGFDASFGAQVGSVQNNSTLEQMVTGAGGSYTLSWFDAGRPGDLVGQTYEVSFGSNILGSFVVASGQGWSSHSVMFTAAAGTDLLMFNGVGTQADGTAFLDKISLTSAPAVSAVPEPESLAMMLAGLAVLGGVARRQRKAA